MPVTAKLSSRFYEKLGDDVTNDLVNWLNNVDAEFRNQLREANDRNWDRLRAEFRSELADFRTEMRTGFADVRTALSDVRSDLRVEIHQESVKQLRWQFGFWTTALLAFAGLKFL